MLASPWLEATVQISAPRIARSYWRVLPSRYLFANTQHEQSARLAIAKNNKMTSPPFKDMQGHFYPGDSGITVCTYPNGKLGNGMRYDTLVSAGFTSPVIAGLIFDGTPASLTAALDVVG
jgi:hypothetical protein